MAQDLIIVKNKMATALLRKDKRDMFIILICVIVLYCLFVGLNILTKGTCSAIFEVNVVPRDVDNEESKSEIPLWEQFIDFEGFSNITGSKDGRYIVPNYIHFIKFGEAQFNFAHAVCVLAAFKNQHPEKIFFHTDVEEFHGKYWDVITSTPGFKDVLVMRKMELPTEVFGQKLNRAWKYFHGGDVARLEVMLEFGGIYLDNDEYVVRSLDDFRRFEMSIGWQYGNAMGSQIIVAHKNARFLRRWYDNYRSYNPHSFYMNAGFYPAFKILKPEPHLVHRVPRLFGNYGIIRSVYLTPWPEWRDFYTLHLLSRHLGELRGADPRLPYPVEFNESNVLDYPVAFRDMCIQVYPYTVQHKLITKIR